MSWEEEHIEAILADESKSRAHIAASLIRLERYARDHDDKLESVVARMDLQNGRVAKNEARLDTIDAGGSHALREIRSIVEERGPVLEELQKGLADHSPATCPLAGRLAALDLNLTAHLVNSAGRQDEKQRTRAWVTPLLIGIIVALASVLFAKALHVPVG